MAANLLKNGDFEDSSSVLNNWNPYNAVPDTGRNHSSFRESVLATYQGGTEATVNASLRISRVDS